MVILLLGGVAAYAIAEEITLTTYYPSPRGVYDQLRTAGNVQFGRIEPPDDPDPNTAPRLHIYRERNGLDLSNAPLLLIEDERPNSGNNPDLTPFVIDENGNVGIGTGSPNPNVKLDVAGQVKADDVCLNSNPPTCLSAVVGSGGAVWGGQYELYGGGCFVNNPLTSQCTCPAGFTDSVVYQGWVGNSLGNDIHACWKAI